MLLAVTLCSLLGYNCWLCLQLEKNFRQIDHLSSMVKVANAAMMAGLAFELITVAMLDNSQYSEKWQPALLMTTNTAMVLVLVYCIYLQVSVINPLVRPTGTAKAGSAVEYPSTVAHVQYFVDLARMTRRKLRVRGSGHSCPAAIMAGDGDVNVCLSMMNRVLEHKVIPNHSHEPRHLLVTVQAGMHMGHDPSDPLSTEANSLNFYLDKQGFALPDMGGISRQTVGGFMSTGSAGGSTKYDFGDSIMEIKMVNGKGQVVVYTRPGFQSLANQPARASAPDSAAPAPDLDVDPLTSPDSFYAAGVSLGLLGVIVSVTFRCEPKFSVRGTNATRPVGETGRPSALEQRLQASDYNRLLWFPQKGVQKEAFWSGNRVSPDDLPESSCCGPSETDKPVRDFPLCCGSQRPMECVVGCFYGACVYDTVQEDYSCAKMRFIRCVLNLVESTSTANFFGRSSLILPMDNASSDTLVPTNFTELWLPIEVADAAVLVLANYFENYTPPTGEPDHSRKSKGGDMRKTGPYAIEIYPAKKSCFWMSPSSRRDTVRIDLFWFGNPFSSPERFFSEIWRVLRQFDARFHWGKWLAPPDGPLGHVHLRKSYGPEHWDRFLKLRKEADPDNVFLTKYWEEHLGIDTAEAVNSEVDELVSVRRTWMQDGTEGDLRLDSVRRTNPLGPDSPTAAPAPADLPDTTREVPRQPAVSSP